MKKILFLVFIAIFNISSAFAYTEADLFRDLKGCRTYEKKPKEINGIVTGGRGQIILNNQERNISIYGIPVTLSCQYPDLLIKCDGSINIPQCNGKSDEFVNIDKKSANRAAALPGTSGANGMRTVMPYIYLLPYWMGRYHGLLGD